MRRGLISISFLTWWKLKIINCEIEKLSSNYIFWQKIPFLVKLCKEGAIYTKQTSDFPSKFKIQASNLLKYNSMDAQTTSGSNSIHVLSK